MFNKSSLTVMAMFAGLAFTVQAEMLYQFKFETKDGKTSLSNSGKAGGNAKVVEFAGKGVDFVNDAPVKGLTACNFILQKSRQRQQDCSSFGFDRNETPGPVINDGT